MPPTFKRVLGCLLSIVMIAAGVTVTFPQTPNDVTIELYYDSTWNSINSFVYHRTMNPITIVRGRQNEARNCDPGTASFELNNRDGRFSPKNPNSPLFGKIGRNTPVRFKVTYGATTYIRFVGEITSWPSRWDLSEKDIWVPVTASGILRRLSQGSKPLQSSLYRTMIGAATGDVVPTEYWSLEDGPDATQFASAVGGLPGKGVAGFSAADVPIPAGHSGIPGSSTSVALALGAKVVMPVRPYADTGQWILQGAFISDDLDDGEPAMGVVLANGTRIIASVIDAGIEVQNLSVEIHAADDSVIFAGDNDVSNGGIVGDPMSIVIASIDTGPGDTFLVRVLDGAGTVRAEVTTTNVGYGAVTQVEATTGGGVIGQPFVGASHVGLFTDAAFDVDVDTIEGARATSGWNKEPAGERFAHLCEQAQIPYQVIGDADASALMGPERTVSRLQSMRDAEATDQGFLFETRSELGLAFRTNASRYNQVPLQLDYGSHIGHPFDPEPDDRGVANDREVKRREGSSARRELASGPLSIQDPPDGVGRYDDSITVDVYSDDQVEHMAAWRLHIGTWDAERYPRVKVDLAYPGNSGIVADIAGLDSGDLITIDNLPAWLPPETCELLVEGYTEHIGFFTWDFTFNCSPAGAYNTVGVWGLLGQELHTAMNTSTTSADIATTSGPLLKTSGLGSGYPIAIGSERLQVTAVAASTVTYGAAGTAAHANNTSVVANLPASVATGHLLLILAAIRNSGTGVVNAPTGYTRLPVFPSASNVQLFGKIATSSESNPTVTITGGAANADVSAQMIRLTGKWHTINNVIASGGKAYASRLNPSAQNITYPGLSLPDDNNCIVLYLGWKQDDFTSVATIAGATEIGEASTTTGDDQSLVWDYVIQTTAAAIPSGAFVVTGGASAISRGAVVALRCDYQTATVERSINGVSASHSAADAVTAVNPLRWALV